MDDAAQDFFRGVEDHFIGRRGRPLLLSPSDVSRVAEWHAAGIPLATVVEGIDVYFDRLVRRGRAPRRAVTLAYVEDDVLDAWAGTRHRRMGKSAAAGQPGAATALATPEEHARLLALLAEIAAQLSTSGGQPAGPAEKAVAAAVAQARDKLAAKAELFDPSRADHDEQKAEDHLRRLERSLATVARDALGTGVAALEAEVAAELEGKRERMSAATLERVSAQLLDKKLRHRFGIPRLSLFYA